MPIVFVHGVGQRPGPEFELASRRVEALLRSSMSSLFDDNPEFQILQPFWGEMGAVFKWNFASFDVFETESLGIGLPLLHLLHDHKIGSVEDIAAKSAPDFLDLVWMHSDPDAETARAIASLIEDAEFSQNLRSSDTLDELIDITQEFVERFEARNSSGEETFGSARVWPQLLNAIHQLKAEVVSCSAAKVTGFLHNRFKSSFALFMGDILTYLSHRGTYSDPGEIPLAVMSAIDQANKIDEPLILIGHSMGGIILFDILSYFMPQTKCNWFVSVGSQISVFEELKLFQVSNPNLPRSSRDRAPKPECVEKWLNILDRGDALGFPAEGVFSDVHDRIFDSNSLFPASHSNYFQLPSFYNRLASHLAD